MDALEELGWKYISQKFDPTNTKGQEISLVWEDTNRCIDISYSDKNNFYIDVYSYSYTSQGKFRGYLTNKELGALNTVLDSWEAQVNDQVLKG